MSIVQQPIDTLLEKRFLDYALSVITDRAIPSVHDGLKPVQRRILWAMYKLNLFNHEKTKKCAKIVGDTMGDYHPHGNVSIYGALVRLAQEWILNAPLIHPQGNFGSIDDSTSFAADRYTEAKLTKIAAELLEHIEHEVDFIPTYSNESTEPVVLPAKFPNLLVNGAKGIAVGMATEIPPHNLGEVLDAQIAYIKNPGITLEELLKIIPGPDFPTGGIIRGKQGIKEMYATGKGKFQIVCKFKTENEKSGRKTLYITDVPYGVEKAALVNQIKEAILPQAKKEKKSTASKPLIEGIDSCVDRSGEETTRNFKVELQFKKSATEDLVKNQLLKFTNAQFSYSANIVALDGKRPFTLTLRDILERFHQFRRECLTRKFTWQKTEAEKKAHRFEGFVKVLDDIDRAVKIIKAAKVLTEAIEGLKTSFSLSDSQAKDVLDLQLRKLTSLEVTKIKDELAELKKEIERLSKILGDVKLLDQEIIIELTTIKKNYATPRKTLIEEHEVHDFNMEDLIDDQECVLTISQQGYVNRFSVEDYRLQKRGGKGSSSTNLVEDDHISDVYAITSKSYLFCFTNTGKLYWIKGYEIPLNKKGTRGRPLINYIEDLKASESIVSIVPIQQFKEDQFLLFITKNGIVKKSSLDLYKSLRKSALQAVRLQENDSLREVLLVNNKQDVIVGTQQGIGLRTSIESIKLSSRAAIGVKLIRLVKGDKVIAAEILDDSQKSLLAVTANCFGKKTLVEEYHAQNRGGKGTRLIKLTENDYLVNLLVVEKEDNLLIMSEQGQTICIRSSSIRNSGKATRGVKIINLENDKIKTLMKLNKGDTQNGEN